MSATDLTQHSRWAKRGVEGSGLECKGSSQLRVLPRIPGEFAKGGSKFIRSTPAPEVAKQSQAHLGLEMTAETGMQRLCVSALHHHNWKHPWSGILRKNGSSWIFLEPQSNRLYTGPLCTEQIRDCLTSYRCPPLPPALIPTGLWWN